MSTRHIPIVPFLALALLTSGGGNSEADEAKPPSIIFILADDLGYGDVGCYGQKLIQTPHIDSLARDGMRFTNAYCGAPVCSPSRCVLMTGLHTGHCRVRGNSLQGFRAESDQPIQSGRVPLRLEDLTIAEILKMAGYVTALIGKWGLGEPGTTGEPNRQGFDEFFGYLNNDHADDYYTPFLWHNGKKEYLEGNKEKKRGRYTTDVFTEKAEGFIRANKDRRFFLYLAYTAPHARYEVPDLGIYADKDWSDTEKTYAAMITRMDAGIGRVLALLQELGIADNTIVFFSSDNGRAPAAAAFRFQSAAHLRGGKGTLFEGGVRVPMLVRWPGRVPAGKTSDQPWYFADMLPTAADIARASPPKNTDGISVLPTLLGEKQNLRERFLYWEQTRTRSAARFGDWKFISSGELFNLAEDPGEQRNVAAQNARVVAMFRDYLKGARTDWAP